MTQPRRKSGSALIIVLGFLSFMVVSAVAFAVYMRTERVASSGFHRSATVRQMVKAGVANAIAQLDYAIGDDPFPGLYRTDRSNDAFIDRFDNRCVFSPDTSEDTFPVRVLPFEGLAYLPPAIINEVRSAARRTPTAGWQNLDYDVGRYAYVAVNVSDFFDINKVRFGSQRSSSPSGRISLSYLFQNKTGTELAVSAGKLKDIDTFLKERGGGESSVPFVSLADFNVALYSKASDYGEKLGIYSPFYGYLAGRTGSAIYARSGDEDETLAECAGRMLFVTDSWQHPTNSAAEVIDLAKEEDQPFLKTAFNNSDRATVLTLLNKGIYGRAYHDRFEQDLSLTSLACLYDYLDDNSMPLSLAIPGVERVPMVGAVDANALSLTLKREASDPKPAGTQGQENLYISTTTYKIDPLPAPQMVKVVMAYPFKGDVTRKGETPDKKSYQIQVMAKMFFANTSACNADDKWCGRYATSMANPSQYPIPSSADWNSAGKAKVDNNCITLVSDKQPIKFPHEDIETMDENDAVFVQIVSLPSLSKIKADLESNFLLQVQKLQKKREDGTFVDAPNEEYPKVMSFKMQPFKAEDEGGVKSVGMLDTSLADTGNGVQYEKANCWKATSLTPLMAVWVRVIGRVNGQEKTLDLAPASFADDVEVNSAALSKPQVQVLSSQFGDGRRERTMLVAAGKPISFSKDVLGIVESGAAASAESVSLFQSPRAGFVVPDPRFNNSPENYYATANAVDAKGYMAAVNTLLGKDGRDSDISMFASDQQYMQSIGELSFLPMVGEFGNNKGDYNKLGNAKIAFPDSLGGIAANSSHLNMFWRTYPLYLTGNQGNAEDCIFQYFSSQIESGDKVIVSDLNGYKVSPYSEIEKIRLAVTANTPYDFWAASTNASNLVNNKPPCWEGMQPKSMDESLKYCFNEMTDDSHKLVWRDVTNITERLFYQMREDARKGIDWEDSFSSMDWASNGDTGKIFGYELDSKSADLFCADRKMLYSFWHDSLSNRQQLFLVFVRVESIPIGANDTFLGNGDENKVQSYGGRAVALVWRDPHPSPSASKVTWFGSDGRGGIFGRSRHDGTFYAPHSSRILFYHQFD